MRITNCRRRNGIILPWCGWLCCDFSGEYFYFDSEPEFNFSLNLGSYFYSIYKRKISENSIDEINIIKFQTIVLRNSVNPIVISPWIVEPFFSGTLVRLMECWLDESLKKGGAHFQTYRKSSIRSRLLMNVEAYATLPC